MDDVIAGLAAAAAAGLTPVKVNAVLMRGFNEDEAVPLARWGRAHGYEVRFIEWMPLDFQHGWSREKLVPAAEIVAFAVAWIERWARRPGVPFPSATCVRTTQ
jgi:cyclic pyranopterin phosphate synthase